jgi:hypothetical protein
MICIKFHFTASLSSFSHAGELELVEPDVELLGGAQLGLACLLPSAQFLKGGQVGD